MVRCKVKSVDTAKLMGNLPVSLYFDNTETGVNKIHFGDIRFIPLNAGYYEYY